MVGGMASDMVLVLFVMRVSRMGVKTLNSIFCFFVYGGGWGKSSAHQIQQSIFSFDLVKRILYMMDTNLHVK